MKAPLRVVVAGGTSAIAQEAARVWARGGAALFLAGRNGTRLSAVAEDLLARGASRCDTHVLDLGDASGFPGFLDAAEERLGGIDVFLVAHGSLPDQNACESSIGETVRAIELNFVSVAALLTLAAPRLVKTKAVLAVISSVAGDRGRPSNYVYGAAKAGLTAFLSGLRARLARSGVAVITVKPGLVDTPMTAHLPSLRLAASAGSVGRGIVRAVAARKDVVYLPSWWALVMLAVRLIPEPVFKRLRS